MKKNIILVSIIVLLSYQNLNAQDNNDIQGSADNPIISRYNGSFIKFFNTVKWDDYILPVSKIKNANGSKTWENKLKLEGEVNRIQYVTSNNNTASLVYMNYINALIKSNWEILFKGSGDNELGNESYEWSYYLFGNEGYQPANKFGSKFKLWGNEHAYIAAKFEDNDTIYYASVYIIEKDDLTIINQDVIKMKNPDVGLVTAKLMTDKISKKGHIVLDGIFFETGKSVILVKSDEALKNIAEYLKANKDKKFYVVGHTDNVGTFQLNIILSENRAKAVMNELITKYDIPASQLKTYGVANLSPMISNESDSGKSKNRRVEIVEQ